MQYLIRTLTDSTGHTFTHVTQARENETFTVVEADSKEEAKEKAKQKQHVFTKEQMHAILNSDIKIPKFK
ncbi:DUF1381 domain-containing protein [Staphylococcus pseudoxylosus]|uniref:DUF1381 domain-containing protein n=1 Tax=Staphylococcus pseudoxylosus TaxID=2282419 RepID=UPI002DBD9989|nr:DUF1381 domain-containing protein [Staphylococcus pseudoxylosus]